MTPRTHASFFSGAGGMDIGLERAGWRTVSFSEIEPYPSAILAERWPNVPNLGDITAINDGGPWSDATLWSGGFPCQDLSIAGRRSGFGGERSVLAFTFLDLVERHRPPAFLLENVTGLLTSNAGRDAGRLFREVGDLRYRWAYRVLDAQWFGVPQRRRRVFLLALDADRYPSGGGPAEVLAIGEGCGRDHPAERAARSHASRRPPGCAPEIGWNASAQFGRWDPAGGVTQTLATRDYKSSNTIVRGDPPPDAGRVRAADGMAGGLDHREDLEGPRKAFVKARRAQSAEDFETWVDGLVAPTLNLYDGSDTRATAVVAGPLADQGIVTALTRGMGVGGPDAGQAQAGWIIEGREGPEDALLPLGLDSHRYRAIGNGVASPVAEWLGRRIAAYLDTEER